MVRRLHLLPALFLASTLMAQSYTQTLPVINGTALYNWRAFSFTGTPSTTGDAQLSFYWIACYQSSFGGSSKVWVELQTGASTYTQVYYETGNTSDCATLSRSTTVPANVLVQALAVGGGNVNGRVKVQDACQAGVGCAFYNDPVVGDLRLTYNVQAADFTVSDASICPGSTVSFTDQSLNTPSAYEWHFVGGAPATSTAQNPVVQYATPGQYDVTLIVTTANGNDTLVRAGQVTVLPLPLANAGVDEVMCAGGSTQLQAGGGVSYAWFPATGLDDPNSAAPMASPENTTTYTVLVTDANGCQASDAVTLTVRPLPDVQATVTGGNTVCAGDTADVQATGAALYNWSPNLFISSTSGAAVRVWPTGTFTWTVSATDLAGCAGETTVTITVVPAPVAPIITQNGSALDAGTAEGYQWYVNGEPIVGANSATWEPLMNGNYAVEITDANGCTARSAEVYYGSVGITDAGLAHVRIYPQPVHDVLRVDGLDRTLPVDLFDAKGSVVLHATLGPKNATLDVSGLPAGTYTLALGAQGRRVLVVKE